MVNDILLALWFLLPAGGANATPVVAAKLPVLRRWQTPMDFGYSFRGKRIFGDHKTWRGLLAGMVVATIILWLQQRLVVRFDALQTITQPVAYASLPVLLLGPLFGFGALAGDAIESFFKRQRGIESGKPWLFFDQVDYIVGAIVASLAFVVLPLSVYIWMLVLWIGIHLLVTYVSWLIGLKDAPI